MLVGTNKAMNQAREYRKILGGGNAASGGFLPAAGLIALEEMPKRLAEDHVNAKLLAEGIATFAGHRAGSQKTVVTNIVIFDIADTGLKVADFVARSQGAWGAVVRRGRNTRFSSGDSPGCVAGRLRTGG